MEDESQTAGETIELNRNANALNIGGYKRHMFLCVGPDCCTPEQGQETWDYLKRRCKELGLVNGPVYRSKVGCLRICRSGPTAVVYPEGSWYYGVTPEVCEKIVHSHLVNEGAGPRAHVREQPASPDPPRRLGVTAG